MKIGFIGMGNMAFAIAKGIITSQYVDAKDIYAYDINTLQLDNIASFGVQVKESNIALIKECDLIILAVKPQVLEKVLLPLKEVLKEKAILSIALGYHFEQFNTLLDSSTRHLTIMPNTPCLVNEGMTVIEKASSLTTDEMSFVRGMLESIGSVVEVDSHLMGVAGALSGCGPAYIYMIIEGLADGAVKQGLPRDIAYKLASQTVLGSGKMQLETGIHPGILKDNVCSPGGSTIRGVHALENGQLRSLMMNAIEKSLNK